MTSRTQGWWTTAPLWVLAVVASLYLLRSARTLLIPIALAVLLSYALEPVVAWLERQRIPRLIATSLVMLVILGATVLGAYALRDDAMQLVESVPQAVQRARETMASQIGGSDAVAQATQSIAGETGESSAAAEPSAGGTPQPTVSLAQRAVNAVFALAWHSVVVFFLIGFLLASGRRVRDRMVEVAGPDPERQRNAGRILDDINAQIQRYLLVLLVTGLIVAAATWLVLALMGVRHALFWGFAAGIFNSIPYFGPIIVSGGLFIVGLMQDGGLAQALQMSGAAIVITSLEGWLLTPALMGRAERMSALTVFLGLLLWIWIWGEWGTILAVPMLVLIKSVADHVDRLKPLGRLMSP